MYIKCKHGIYDASACVYCKPHAEAKEGEFWAKRYHNQNVEETIDTDGETSRIPDRPWVGSHEGRKTDTTLTDPAVLAWQQESKEMFLVNRIVYGDGDEGGSLDHPTMLSRLDLDPADMPVAIAIQNLAFPFCESQRGKLFRIKVYNVHGTDVRNSYERLPNE